ncbi:hypothetical protein OG21DRAFT_1484291 [Imleria badia]|nr:hypothetical protein OG21DRAFT_1484291 [Imleria badia]
MSGTLFQFACWTYLPDFATRQALSVIHQLSQRVFNIPPPPPRSPHYIRHYRYTYAAIVLCYLTYNFIDASSGLPINFYELLGVSPRSDEGALKAAFRAFARKNHPDRIGPEGEALFIEVRDAFEALKDPVVRFAYDRFGPDVLRWRDCTTMKDYLRRGLLNSLPRHIMTGIALFLFSVVGKQSPVAAWRYLLFIGLFALELYLMVAPTFTPPGASGYTFVDQIPAQWMLFESVFPQRVAYQHILFLHQVFMFMSVAVSRVTPVLFAGMTQEMDGEVVRAMGGRIGELSRGIEREVWLMLNTELHAAGVDEFDYARTINSYPQRAEKQAILASLRSITGNESFTMPKLTNWFARHRNPSDDSNVSVLLDDETILFPKLTRMHLQQLRILYKKRADPSEGIIHFWAERIKADKDEIVAWIQYQQEKAKEDVRASPESPEIPLKQLVGDSGSPSVSPTVSEFPRPHLPTPAKSPSISPHTRMPSLPPIAVKVEESRQCVSPVSSLNTPFLSTIPRPENRAQPSEPRALEGFPPLLRLLHTTKLVPVATSVPNALLRVGGQPHRRDLEASIRDSLRPHAPPSEPPRTVDEFAAKFESVESMIDAFIKKYDSGQLVRLGWDSSLSKVTP